MEKCTSENRGSNSLGVFVLDFAAPVVRIVFQKLENPLQYHENMSKQTYSRHPILFRVLHIHLHRKSKSIHLLSHTRKVSH